MDFWEGVGGQGTPPPSRDRLRETGFVNDTEMQTGNDNSLAATNPQVAEGPTPEPKAREVETEEEEVVGPSLEPRSQDPPAGEPRGGKRKPSHDGSDEVKKAGKTEAVAPLSGQSLDRIQIQIDCVDSQTRGSPPPDNEVSRAIASILNK